MYLYQYRIFLLLNMLSCVCRSVRTLFGEDEACYIMDAKVQGNIGRYLNVSIIHKIYIPSSITGLSNTERFFKSDQYFLRFGFSTNQTFSGIILV